MQSESPPKSSGRVRSETSQRISPPLPARASDRLAGTALLPARSRHPGLWTRGSATPPHARSAIITFPYNWRGFLDLAQGKSVTGPPIPPDRCKPPCNLTRPPAWSASPNPEKSNPTFPNRAVVRLDFPARGQRPAVKVFYHDGAGPGDPEAYHVPGMENERILPSANNLAEKGPSDRRASPGPRRRPSIYGLRATTGGATCARALVVPASAYSRTRRSGTTRYPHWQWVGFHRYQGHHGHLQPRRRPNFCSSARWKEYVLPRRR